MAEYNAGNPVDQTAFTLGEIRSDVKHILLGLANIEARVEKVKEEAGAGLSDLDTRLTTVETFNTKVLTLASIGIPLMTVLVNVGVVWFRSAIGG